METNAIYCGDSLEVMKKFKDNSIDLIYLDPPFFSKKEYEDFWIKDKITKLKFSDSKKHWEGIKKMIKPNILKQYEDIEKRVALMPNPVSILVKRILSEMQDDDLKYYVFARPPAKKTFRS